MRFCSILAMVVLLSTAATGQRQSVLTASLISFNKMDMARNSFDIPEWHEKTFWPMYEHYNNRMNSIAIGQQQALKELSETTTADIGTYAKTVLNARNEQLKLLLECYNQMGNSFNGVIAFQFLQTEVLMDMMTTSDLYDRSKWKQFRFHPGALEDAQMITAKRNMINKAVNLNADQLDQFWNIYSHFENEVGQLLGEHYDIISMFAGDPDDYTPALAKRLGANLITLLEREQRLKEKYFLEVERELGGEVAGKFFAWEDYFSVVSKMYAWAEAR